MVNSGGDRRKKIERLSIASLPLSPTSCFWYGCTLTAKWRYWELRGATPLILVVGRGFREDI